MGAGRKTKMIRPLSIVGAAMLFVAGCVDMDGFGFGEEETSTGGDRAAYASKSPLEATPAPLPRRKPLPDVDTDIDGLIGLSFVGTAGLLGQPALEEVKPPAKVWTYNGRGCALRIFFYPDVGGEAYRALTYEVKAAEDSADLSQRCFAALLLEQRKARVQ